jgi:hypothetical protein
VTAVATCRPLKPGIPRRPKRSTAWALPSGQAYVLNQFSPSVGDDDRPIGEAGIRGWQREKMNALVEEVSVGLDEGVDRNGEALLVRYSSEGHLALPNAGDLGLDLRPCRVRESTYCGGMPLGDAKGNKKQDYRKKLHPQTLLPAPPRSTLQCIRKQTVGWGLY